MSSFTEPLAFAATDIFTGGSLIERPVLLSGRPEMVCELVGARRLYRVERGFRFVDPETDEVYVVEANFLTDLGSIPRLAQWLVSPDAPYAQAFVLHDRLYQHLRQGTLPGLTRAKADLVMWRALGLPFRVYTVDRGDLTMRRAMCPAALRSAIYYAVRLGGANKAAESG